MAGHEATPYAFERQGQRLAVSAHPANLARWHADHERVIRHIATDHRTGTDKGMSTDGGAADHGAVRAERRALADQRLAQLSIARHRGTRIEDVGEHDARAAEDVVFECHSVVDRHIVLDVDVGDRLLDFVADGRHPGPGRSRPPMRAPAHTCAKCDTRVPAPSCAPGSTTAVG